MIKIDVEGYEFPVLKGLRNYFEGTTHRPIIICEITPSAYPLLDIKLTQLAEYMKKYNYRAYRIDNIRVKVDITKLEKTTEVVFISNAMNSYGKVRKYFIANKCEKTAKKLPI